MKSEQPDIVEAAVENLELELKEIGRRPAYRYERNAITLQLRVGRDQGRFLSVYEEVRENLLRVTNAPDWRTPIEEIAMNERIIEEFSTNETETQPLITKIKKPRRDEKENETEVDEEPMVQLDEPTIIEYDENDATIDETPFDDLPELEKQKLVLRGDTRFLPGSVQRMRIIEQRMTLKLSTHHPNDRQLMKHKRDYQYH